jgi:alpha-amylase
MQGRCSAIDFTVHWHLQDVLDKGYPMQHLNGCGLSARDPTHAVTFVDSPDTDSSFGQQIQNSKLLAYAFIAAIEGVPQIYYRDWSDDPDCYGLGTQIDNLVWINRHLAGGSTVTRYLDDNCVVLNRVGYGAKPGLLMAINKDTWNSKTLTVATSFWPHTQLHDYTGRHHDIWTDANGWTTFTVPSNAFGGGQGYLCFGPLPQYVPAVSPHALTTVQEFEGADDLDIGPAVAGKTTEVTRIWVAVGTTVDLKLTHPEFAGAISPVATDPLGRVITSAVPSETLSFVATAEGWHELKIRGAVFYPLGTKIPFTLSAVYEAPAAAALA